MRKKLIFSSSLVFLFLFYPALCHADMIVISAADMLPETDETDYVQNGQYLYLNNGSPGTYFYAPVHLPAGVRIRGAQVIIYDESDEDLYVSLYRMPLWTLESQGMFGLTVYGKPGNYKHTLKGSSIRFKRIQENAVYFLRVRIIGDGDGPNLKFRAVKIWW